MKLKRSEFKFVNMSVEIGVTDEII